MSFHGKILLIGVAVVFGAAATSRLQGQTHEPIALDIPTQFEISYPIIKPYQCYRVPRPANGQITVSVAGEGEWDVCIGDQMCPVDCMSNGMRTATTENLTDGKWYYPLIVQKQPKAGAILSIFPTAMGAPLQIAGNWTYDGNNGRAKVDANGSLVVLHLTNLRRTAAAPHYVLEGSVAGRKIRGTWRFVVAPLQGLDERFQPNHCRGGKFSAEISADGNSIRFHDVHDPCNHSLNGLVIKKVVVNEPTRSVAGNWTYDGSHGTAAINHDDQIVYMQLANDRRSAGAPHYVLEGTVDGRMITGTWRFVVTPLVGLDERFQGANCKGGRFSAEVSADGKSIRFYDVQDPCNHSFNGLVIHR